MSLRGAADNLGLAPWGILADNIGLTHLCFWEVLPTPFDGPIAFATVVADGFGRAH